MEFLKAGGTRRHQQGMTGGKALNEEVCLGQMVMNSENVFHRFYSVMLG
jgi:hypothetical protein